MPLETVKVTRAGPLDQPCQMAPGGKALVMAAKFHVFEGKITPWLNVVTG